MILQIELNDEMAAELESVRRESNCFTIDQVATECIEVVLAERRLPHVPVAALGARPHNPGCERVELTHKLHMRSFKAVRKLNEEENYG